MHTFNHTYFFFIPRSENLKEKKELHCKACSKKKSMCMKNNYDLPPTRLANDESRSPPIVLVGGGVAGRRADMPPGAIGVPMLPAVLPGVLPPVL